jgi:hypothetical protein
MAADLPGKMLHKKEAANTSWRQACRFIACKPGSVSCILSSTA